ncbi:hypothetical protein KBAD11_02100 [Aeromonas dhakensis]|nr:hypothetical protein KBAD45_02100 [Aeromonas dhakensis]CAD7493905.1 hypothetical protein KBAD59_02110 [Aeromonas dhakensis]CAD7494008.1 hypothetical protein KBAD11_02100 [Aeromonas dhakensis]CAD7496615.1 hypothetical protein KBAD14_KBAD14_02110 [Aeromonas dhakensis]CAD7496684.1 hypothetical protein KBAD10_02110 [Aeromonas dhakensis]
MQLFEGKGFGQARLAEPGAESQAVVAGQIRQREGSAVALQIVWRGAKHRARAGQWPGDVAGILGLADPEDEVEAVADDVHQPIRQIQLDADLRVALHEAAQQRRQPVAAEGNGCIDADPARRLAGIGQGVLLQLPVVLQQALAAGEVFLARLGQALATGVAIEQAGADSGLQPLDVLADHGRRHREALRHGGETARAGNLDEDLDGGQAVHSKLLVYKARRHYVWLASRLSIYWAAANPRWNLSR